jgi:hypothetical protein
MDCDYFLEVNHSPSINLTNRSSRRGVAEFRYDLLLRQALKFKVGVIHELPLLKFRGHFIP